MKNTKAPWSPWPYALIAFFACFISGVVAFTSFALRQKMDLVRPDYYEEELRFQKRIDSSARAKQMGGGASVSYEGSSQSLVIALPGAGELAPGKATLELYRPSDARLDRHLEFSLDKSASQKVPALGLLPGLWRVRLTWGPEAASYLHEEVLVVPSGSS